MQKETTRDKIIVSIVFVVGVLAIAVLAFG